MSAKRCEQQAILFRRVTHFICASFNSGDEADDAQPANVNVYAASCYNCYWHVCTTKQRYALQVRHTYYNHSTHAINYHRHYTLALFQHLIDTNARITTLLLETHNQTQHLSSQSIAHLQHSLSRLCGEHTCVFDSIFTTHPLQTYLELLGHALDQVCTGPFLLS